MDLSKDEVDDYFPDDRGDAFEDTDTSPWVNIAQKPHNWLIVVDGERYKIPYHRETEFISELTKELDDAKPPSMWLVFRNRDTTERVCSKLFSG